MKRYCSFILVVVLIFSLAVSASAANGMETGRIGTQTAAERVYAEQKADAVERMMEIREAYFGNNRTISAEDRSELEALLGRYYPDSSIEKFLSFVNASTRANPGDYDNGDQRFVIDSGRFDAPSVTLHKGNLLTWIERVIEPTGTITNSMHYCFLK